MRFDDLYITGAAAHLPPRVTVAQALERGECDPQSVRSSDLLSVAVSDGESGPEMAASAAGTALRRADADPGEIDLLLHATVYYQGHDLWAPASYVQRRALGNRCPAVEVRQLSNGGMAALELAAGYLVPGSARVGALLTTGDRFCAPGFDRWRSDPGTVYGDGGTALVLSRRPGFARLRSLVTVGDSDLEAMHRGADPFGAAPFEQRRPMDLEVLKRRFIEQVGTSYSVARVSAAQTEVLKQALAEADTELAGIDWFVLPHFGLRRLTSGFLRRWEVAPEDTTWTWGRTVGHLGAGDQFAGLAHLAQSGRLLPGQRCLLVGVGAGYSWSCAVLEVRHTPDWAD
ncbi:3-oxoacyl-[acyl-carrier-protein] synthase-3 [Kitasatospora sp. MAA4]|uniref:ketoacyl-ACP synthase III family protein n=1 Tax=Kitasatospora sp. MAA4 TaxID=3035093 RepID=UPI002476CD6C|nr:ketoacyl-ACP synthase III family protein [Kitasatospora sp. MAA4]MDH6132411.1 3-oxoacyl-[acyl-carrier-protein] synthase-3 [Kitasatospora sp. MAA4]